MATERPLITRANTNDLVQYPDITVSKKDANMQVFTSDSYPINMVLKPNERAGEKHENVVLGGFQQCIKHAAKILTVSFNFGGVGVDGHVTSFVGTLAYIQAVQLKLVATGTSEAKLQIFVSEKFPLLSKTNFQKWVKSNDPKKKRKSPSNDETQEETKRENEIERIQNQLYPDGKTYDGDEGDLPGYKVIQSEKSSK